MTSKEFDETMAELGAMSGLSDEAYLAKLAAMAANRGDRLPNVMEVVKGYGIVLRAAVGQQAAELITIQSALETKRLMQKNDGVPEDNEAATQAIDG